MVSLLKICELGAPKYSAILVAALRVGQAVLPACGVVNSATYDITYSCRKIKKLSGLRRRVVGTARDCR